jgi:hypothetical protein
MNVFENPENITLLILVLFTSASTTIGILAYRINPMWEMLAIVIYSFLSLLTSILVSIDLFYLGALPSNIFTFFEFYLFCFLILKATDYRLKIPTIILVSIFSFILVRTVKTSSLYRLSGGIVVFENIFLTILSLYYYKFLVIGNQPINFEKNFMFWVITGAALYFCLTTPYFVLGSWLTPQNKDLLFLINTVLNATMHCFFIIGFLGQMRSTSVR